LETGAPPKRPPICRARPAPHPAAPPELQKDPTPPGCLTLERWRGVDYPPPPSPPPFTRVKDYLLLEEEYVRRTDARREAARAADRMDATAKAAAAAALGRPPEAPAPGADAEEDRKRLEEFRGPPLSVGSLEELVDDGHAIVSSNVGPEYYVGVASFVDRAALEPGASVLMHHKALAIVGVLPDDADPAVSAMKVETAPDTTYADVASPLWSSSLSDSLSLSLSCVPLSASFLLSHYHFYLSHQGGLERQVQEVREAVELPLLHPEVYEEIGIRPPKGVILYGAPGTGKTLLAKAVANATSATFLRVVGSELIQKYLGEGPKLVRELFRAADEAAPSIVFIDEVDAIGAKRYDARSGGEKEIQRTMLELLNQLDGFDSRGDVKVLLATNRIDALDPALIRPGRVDRKIEFALPDARTKRRIFALHTARMKLAPGVSTEEFVMSRDNLSGADIRAVCTEAGLLALRERRMHLTQEDFRRARDKVVDKKKEGVPEGLYM